MRIFRLGSQGVGTVLGPLENEVMEVVWREAEPVSVAHVHQALARKTKPLAYSTIKAVLSNLTDKGYLRKRSVGRSNLFRAVQTREQFRQRVVAEVLGSLVKDYRNPLIAQLVDELAADPATLDDLERLIASKREKMRRA